MRETRLLQAMRGEPVDTTPVWLMRQAGRYQPEYRALRAKHSFLELCKTPELAAEVTLLPVEQMDVDGAILFCDILVVLEAMGLDVAFVKDAGPVIAPVVRTDKDVAALRPFEPEEELGYVMDAIRLLRPALAGKVPLLGFSGAPFTLASYAVEGGSSRSFHRIKEMMFAAPEAYDALMRRLADGVAAYLRAQIAAGAQAVQIFDTWAGALSHPDYGRYVAPYTRRVISQLGDLDAPVIHYVNGGATLLPYLKYLGADVLGIDWRLELSNVIAALGDDVVLQGNLDPGVLFAPVPEIERRVADIVAQGRKARGHVFNLGHGIHQTTDPGHARALVDAVHRFGRRDAS